MRDHRARVLQQAQVGELQATPMPARKGKGYSGCTEALSDDLVKQNTSGLPKAGYSCFSSFVTIKGR